MNKAEDRALEAYPEDIEKFVDVNGMKSVVDNNSWQRTIFLKGYQQAEKDLELTWDDVKSIFLLVQVEWSPNKNEEEIYQEVLKRFKDFKEK